MFKSRRQPAPQPETAKVADVVQAYYDAGRRPANNRFADPPVSEPETPAAEPETPVAEPQTPVAEHEPEYDAVEETLDEAVQHAVQESAEPAAVASPVLAKAAAPTVRKSLGELADELEHFIEAIRYGDNLGSTQMLSGAAAR